MISGCSMHGCVADAWRIAQPRSPPATGKVTPVMYEASSEAKNRIAAACSSVDLAVPFLLLGARLCGVARDAPRWGFGAAGRHTADADAVRRVFHGERRGDSVDSALRCRVGQA